MGRKKVFSLALKMIHINLCTLTACTVDMNLHTLTACFRLYVVLSGQIFIYIYNHHDRYLYTLTACTVCGQI